MKVVHAGDVQFEERVDKPRAGRFRQKRLMEGRPGAASNYLLQLAETFGDFYSPRHKHNFDQFRFQVSGTFDFSRDGKMTPGTVGYFPEGTPYGPQSSSDGAVALVLQFGGASGNGYMADHELKGAVRALKQHGTFDKGVYTRHEPDGAKKNQDAYEAAWEHHNGRPLEYPKPRFQAPVLMNGENFAWRDVPGEPGIAEKLLGTFDRAAHRGRVPAPRSGRRACRARTEAALRALGQRRGGEPQLGDRGDARPRGR